MLFEETDPRLVFFEIDIFWAYVGQSRFPGFRPHDYVWDNPERFPLFHVKDGRVRHGGPHVRLDDDRHRRGDLPFEPFFCGLDTDDHHFIVESDDPASADPAGPFGFSERSYDYLASLRERKGGHHGRKRRRRKHHHRH